MRRLTFAFFVVFATCSAAFLYSVRLHQAKASDNTSQEVTAEKESTSASESEPAREVDEPQEPENPFPRRLPAPGLEGGVEWLNTSGAITLKDLRGKVVLIDFWTYCCINCIHVLPDLKYLEQKYPNELVVIGVHSAKFENEQDSEAIRDAILRYEIEHPVINDANMLVWRKFGARSWPTLVLIDPEGNYCGYVSGEGMRDVLEENIVKLIEFHAAKGTLDRTPVRFDLERYKAEPTPLRFPGKVLADAASNRLFISDSNHNRIVITSLSGELLDVIGNGRIGRADGSFAEAEFDHPQGMALKGDVLYVADTENHLIRKINLSSKIVSTLAGTGEQARFRQGGGDLETTALNSPWDLLIHDGVLYVAMAGPHQIWSHALGSDQIGVFAGTGREDILDGPHLESALAQPSGLASDADALYVCDSEGSAIRRIPFDTSGEVTTLAGPSDLPNGRSLFEFGDIDDIGENARLQHPLGIARIGDQLFIADSYNHKLKTIGLGAKNLGRVETILGTGKAGDGIDPVQFSEPAGVTAVANALFIADTNNHRILRVELPSKEVAVLKIDGLQPPAAPTHETIVDKHPEPAGDAVTAEPQSVRRNEAIEVNVTMALPDDYKLNELFPTAAVVDVETGNPIVATKSLGKRIKAHAQNGELTFSLPLSGQLGQSTLKVALSYGYCRDGKGGLCKVKTARWLLPLTVSDDGATTIHLTAPSPDE